MTQAERGFLLLTSHFTDPERKVLSVAQFRELMRRLEDSPRPADDRDLHWKDLLPLGYGEEMARRIADLLSQEDLLEDALARGKRAGCQVLTGITSGYPLVLRKRLDLDRPGCLWCKGDASLLKYRAVSLVGSRDLKEDNECFAREVGYQAARQGYALVSGNARGADQVAQQACLEAGGLVISVVADSLADKKEQENLLYLSQDSFDLAFSAQRALSRNRVIHALGQKTFVAQCGYQEGGTWSGTVKNLRYGWSPVYCYADNSPAQRLLQDMGAGAITIEQLADFSRLSQGQDSLFYDGGEL